MSKRKLTYQDFKKYFSNHLQNKDKHAFEKQMMQDAFEEEAFDGLSQLNQFELGNDIAELKSRIGARTKKSRRTIPVWFRYAASVLVLVGIGFSVFFLNSRHWQDSVLKEQIADEMEIADSMLFEAEQDIRRSSQDSIPEPEVKDLLAEHKSAPKEDAEIQESIPLRVMEDELEMEDDLELDEAQASETDMDETIETIEVIEFEEEDEMAVEEIAVSAFKEEERTELAKKGKDKSEESTPHITLRGTATPTANNTPLYVIDGRPVDLNKSKTIKGKVLSSKDKSSIEGVSVQLKEIPVFGTLSDANGDFRLTIPDDTELKTLIASFVGMESLEISIDGDSSLLVYMEPDVMEMDELMVSGASSDQDPDQPVISQAQPPASISILKYKKQVVEALDYTQLSEFPGKYKIQISFTVFTDGSLGNFSFTNTPNQLFSDEIIRVMKVAGPWIPAQRDGRDVSSEMKLSLRIEVNESGI